MRETLLTCDHCGKASAALYPLQRIEERLIDLKAGIEDGPSTARGRTPWSTPRRRDPAVLVRTPRYAYVQASDAVCATCLEAAETEAQGLNRFHRRATLVVALAAASLGAVLLSMWMLWPGAYAGLGLARPNPAQPYAGAPPPTTQPYKPPFSAATPVAP